MSKAQGGDQAHGAVGGSAAMDPDAAASKEKNLQKATGGERRDRRESTKLREREEVKFVTSIVGILMCTLR